MDLSVLHGAGGTVNSVPVISRELLEFWFDTSSELVIAINTESGSLFANRAARQFWGKNYRDNAATLLQGNDFPQLDDSVENQPISISLIGLSGEQQAFRCVVKDQPLEDNHRYRIAILSDVTLLDETNSVLENQKQILLGKARTMEALNNLTIGLINRVDLKSLLQHVADNIARITAADYAYVAMVHESGEYLETIAASKNSDSLESIKHRRGEGIGGEAWRTGVAAVTDDYQNYPHRLPGLSDAKQACSIPIAIADKVTAVLGVMHTSEDVEIHEQREMLENFAQLIGVAIDNTLMHEKTAAELARTEAISELSRLIYSATDFEALLNRVCTTLVSAFNASKAHVYKYNPHDGESLAPLVAWEESNGEITKALQANSATASESIAIWCIRNQETACIAGGVEDPRESSNVRNLRREMNLGCTVCVPLIHGNRTWGILYLHRRLQDPDFTDNDVNLFKVIGNQTSIALNRYELTEKIRHQAYHDTLTKLPNRLRLETLLEERTDTEDGQSNRFALLFIDLDGFKAVNDSLSHRIGDLLLVQVATRFLSCLAPADCLARIGGDEFGVILPIDKSDSHAQTIAQRMLDSLAEEFTVNDAQVNVGASIGISFYPDDSNNAADLLRNADVAMYHAKVAEKGTIAIFQQSHADRYEERLAMERDLKIAIEENQFELYYQPKVSCDSCEASSVEALIRWNHPTRGFVSPLDFISIAEESGLIQQIGHWVIDEACRFGAALIRRGIGISIAVNISAIQFNREEFADTVFSLLEEHDFPPQCLQLELTESVVMKDVDVVVERLGKLRDRGISIAIDDFGTGYSSLKYLEDLPLDVLKIDKAFVDKLGDDANERSLVNTIILMSQAFGLSTVAEGIETAEQFQQVSHLGCDYAQGYYFSKPVAESELVGVLSSINSQSGLKKVG